MQMGPWNSWPETYVLQMLREFDQLFAASLRPFAAGVGQQFPSVEVLDSGTEVVVRAELAGVDPKELDLQVTDDSLTLRGQRRVEAEERGQGYFVSERQYGAFVRTIPFPYPVRSAGARATLQNGLLEVRAPKRPEAQEPGGRRLIIET